MAVLPKHVVDALNHGPQAEPTLTPFEDAVCLLDEGYQQTENGSAETRDGGIEVAVRTDLPGVTPGDVVVVVRMARQRSAALQAVASARPRVGAVDGRQR